jgi:hypothetical protein
MTTQTNTQTIAHGTGSYSALISFGELTEETLPEVVLNGARLLQSGDNHQVALLTEHGDLKYRLQLDGKLNFKFLHGTTVQLEGAEAGTGRRVTVQFSPRHNDEEFTKITTVSGRGLWDLASSSTS